MQSPAHYKMSARHGGFLVLHKPVQSLHNPWNQPSWPDWGQRWDLDCVVSLMWLNRGSCFIQTEIWIFQKKWLAVNMQTSLYSQQGERTKALSYLSELHVSLCESGHGTLTLISRDQLFHGGWVFASSPLASTSPRWVVKINHQTTSLSFQASLVV